MPRIAVLGRWIAYAVATLVVASTFSFLLTRVWVDDPFGTTTPPEVKQRARQEIGLDQPLWRQYVDWHADAVRGDFGNSWFNRRDVRTMVGETTGPTVELLTLVLLVAGAYAVLLEWLRSRARGAWGFATELGGLIPVVIPEFMTLSLFIVLPAIFWSYASPVGVSSQPFSAPWTHFRLYVPIALLVGVAATAMARTVGVATMNVAHAAEFTPRRAARVFAHGICVAFPFALGGMILAERYFAIDGLGNMFAGAALAKDRSALQFLLFAALASSIGLRAIALALVQPAPTTPARAPAGRFHAGWLVIIGAVAVIVLLGVIGPYVAPHNPRTIHSDARYLQPSWAHPFGTTKFGSDVLSQVLFGYRRALKFAVVVMFLGYLPGVVVGQLAAPLASPARRWLRWLGGMIAGLPLLALVLTWMSASEFGLDVVVIPCCLLAFGSGLSAAANACARLSLSAEAIRSTALVLARSLAGLLVLTLAVMATIDYLILPGLNGGGWGSGYANWVSSPLNENWYLGVFPGGALCLTLLCLLVVRAGRHGEDSATGGT